MSLGLPSLSLELYFFFRKVSRIKIGYHINKNKHDTRFLILFICPQFLKTGVLIQSNNRSSPNTAVQWRWNSLVLFSRKPLLGCLHSHPPRLASCVCCRRRVPAVHTGCLQSGRGAHGEGFTCGIQASETGTRLRWWQQGTRHSSTIHWEKNWRSA